MVRGIRGATTAKGNTHDEILAASRELLSEMLSRNLITPEDIACIFFSVTPDLDAAFPATAARELGLSLVPLFGSQEAGVLGSPKRCIRILILLNTEKGIDEIKHVYLGEARNLRPDLA